MGGRTPTEEGFSSLLRRVGGRPPSQLGTGGRGGAAAAAADHHTGRHPLGRGAAHPPMGGGAAPSLGGPQWGVADPQFGGPQKPPTLGGTPSWGVVRGILTPQPMGGPPSEKTWFFHLETPKNWGFFENRGVPQVRIREFLKKKCHFFQNSPIISPLRPKNWPGTPFTIEGGPQLQTAYLGKKKTC